MENYLSIDQVIQKIKDQTKKPFDAHNLANLVFQGGLPPVFSHIGYICTVGDDQVWDFSKGSRYLKPFINSELISLIQGSSNELYVTWVEGVIQTIKENEHVIAPIFCESTIDYMLFDYDVLDTSPKTTPMGADGFLHNETPSTYLLKKSSLYIAESEVDRYLELLSEKDKQNSTFLNSSDVRVSEKNLRVIGAMLYALMDSEVQRPHKINQSGLAQTIEDLTKNSNAGMSKSTLEKLFRDANKAFEPYKPKNKK